MSRNKHPSPSELQEFYKLTQELFVDPSNGQKDDVETDGIFRKTYWRHPHRRMMVFSHSLPMRIFLYPYYQILRYFKPDDYSFRTVWLPPITISFMLTAAISLICFVIAWLWLGIPAPVIVFQMYSLPLLAAGTLFLAVGYGLNLVILTRGTPAQATVTKTMFSILAGLYPVGLLLKLITSSIDPYFALIVHTFTFIYLILVLTKIFLGCVFYREQLQLA